MFSLSGDALHHVCDLSNPAPPQNVNLEIEYINFRHIDRWEWPQGIHSGTTLTSLKVRDWGGDTNIQASHVRSSLTAHKHLQTLTLGSEHGDMMFEQWAPNFSEATRTENANLPPLKKLILKDFNWNHSPRFATTFFDWTCMTHLELVRVPILPFLQSVDAKHLTGLQVFKTDGWKTQSTTQLPVQRLLADLIKAIKKLRSLQLKAASTGGSHMSRILRHKETLFELDMRRFAMSPTYVTMDTFYVRRIPRGLPKITDLTLEQHFMEWSADVDEWCDAVCDCRNLRRLTLYGEMHVESPASQWNGKSSLIVKAPHLLPFSPPPPWPTTSLYSITLLPPPASVHVICSTRP